MALSADLDESYKKWEFKHSPFGEKYPYYDKFWAMPERDRKLLEFLLPGIMHQNEVLNVLIQGEYGSGYARCSDTLLEYTIFDLID